MNKFIYLLKSDGDGTLRSKDESVGYAVLTEEEAQKWAKEYTYGYSNSYEKIEISSLEDIVKILWSKVF